MTNARKIIELQTQAAEIENKIKDLVKWLGKNTASPYFMKVASDRNHYLVKLDALNYKINQLKCNLPILGEPEFAEHTTVGFENNNQFKTIQ